MRLCTYTLQEVGVPPANIKKENFVIHHLPLIEINPPDKEPHTVKLHLAKKVYSVEVQYPDSILKAAEKQGVSLPYSCRAGSCGNCVAQCIGGNVWHAYNDVLTEADLQKGLILTCVGYPVGGDVELMFY